MVRNTSNLFRILLYLSFFYLTQCGFLNVESNSSTTSTSESIVSTDLLSQDKSQFSTLSVVEGKALNIDVKINKSCAEDIIYNVEISGEHGEDPSIYFDLNQTNFILKSGETIAQFSLSSKITDSQVSTIKWTLKLISQNPKISSTGLINFEVNAIPMIVSVNSEKANGTYTVGEVIDINILFNNPVTVTSGVPYLELNSNSSARAIYQSGSGSSTLLFRYTVGAGDTTSKLEYPILTSLKSNDAIIEDSNGNSANLNLPIIGGGLSLGSVKNIVIDAINPNTAPSNLTLVSWSSSTTQSPNLTFAQGIDLESGIDHHEVKIINYTNADTDLNSFTSFTSGSSISGLSLTPGNQYYFKIRAVDRAGNFSVETSSSFWTVDTTNPTATGTISIGAYPANYTQITPLFLFAESTDSISGIASYKIEIRSAVDDSIVKNYVTASGNGTTGLNYNEGSNIFVAGETYYTNIKAVDNVGNEGPVVQSPNWTPPGLLISSKKITANTNFSFVDLDVDWTRNLAYMASRFPNTCVDTASFADLSNVTKVNKLVQQCLIFV